MKKVPLYLNAVVSTAVAIVIIMSVGTHHLKKCLKTRSELATFEFLMTRFR